LVPHSLRNTATICNGHAPDCFRRVRVDPELRTIVWPNGFDLDPDVLHGDYEPALSPGSIARPAPN